MDEHIPMITGPSYKWWIIGPFKGRWDLPQCKRLKSQPSLNSLQRGCFGAAQTRWNGCGVWEEALRRQVQWVEQEWLGQVPHRDRPSRPAVAAICFRGLRQCPSAHITLSSAHDKNGYKRFTSGIDDHRVLVHSHTAVEKSPRLGNL